MATKTISIELDVYDRLKALKVSPGDSFSQVLRRLLTTGGIVTGADVLRMMQDTAYANALSEEELNYLEHTLEDDQARILGADARKAG